MARCSFTKRRTSTSSSTRRPSAGSSPTSAASPFRPSLHRTRRAGCWPSGRERVAGPDVAGCPCASLFPVHLAGAMPYTEDTPIATRAPNESLALMLGGGGARGAYQAGVLRAIAKRHPTLRLPILTGISAGAVNTTFLAAQAAPLPEASDQLVKLWLS